MKQYIIAMFLIQQFIEHQLSKQYQSLPKLSTFVKTSFSNLITLKDQNISFRFFYIECFQYQEKLLFQIMQFKVLYQGVLATSSKATPLDSQRLNLFTKDVIDIKIDIVPSMNLYRTYTVLILIKNKEKKVTSFIFNLQIFTNAQDSQEIIKFGQILPFDKTVRKINWLPPLLPYFQRHIIEITDSQIAVHQIQYNFNIIHSFSFDLFGELETNLVGFDFMEILKPFNQHVMVLLQKNGTVIFGSILARQMLDNQYIKVYLKHYFRGNSIESEGRMMDFFTLSRENLIKNLKSKRQYTSLKVINFNKHIFGVSFLVLTSFQATINGTFQINIQTFLIKIDKNHIQLLPLTIFTKFSTHAGCQIIYESVDDKKVFVIIDSEVWVVNFSSIIAYGTKMNYQELKKCIKIQKQITIEDTLRYRVFKQTKWNLYNLSFCNQNPKFQIIQVQPDKDMLEEVKKIMESKIESIFEQEQQGDWEFESDLQTKNVDNLSLAQLVKEYSQFQQFLDQVKAELTEQMNECLKMSKIVQQKSKQFSNIFSQKKQTFQSFLLKIEQNQKLIKQLTSQSVSQDNSSDRLLQIFEDVQSKLQLIQQSYLWPEEPRFDPNIAAAIHSFFSRTLIVNGMFRTLEYRTSKALQTSK